MENASKALIMAGSILIALMVISLGVYIFSIYSSFTADVEEQKQMHAIMEFNKQFEKYNRDNVTAHDIVTIANLAKEHNRIYEGQEYIIIKVNSQNFETKTMNEYTTFISNNSYSEPIDISNPENSKVTFQCTNCEYNESTKKISIMEFSN